jgi:hypothetical protein
MMANTSLNQQTSGESGAAFFVTSDINENNTAGSQLNSLFSVVASWAPENNNFSSPGKILRVQQLALHTKYSKFQQPVGLLSDKFHGLRPNCSGLGLLYPF